MSQIVPYKTPIFSWPLDGSDGPYEITFTSVGPNTTFATPYTFTWTGWQTNEGVFPFLATQLTTALNSNKTDSGTFICRWVFESGASLSPLQTSTAYAFSPKLVISYTNTPNYTSGRIDIDFTSPTQSLDTDYRTSVGQNWIGASGPSSTINFATNFGSFQPHLQLPYAPYGVWNPGVLQYGDRRTLRRTLGISTNPFSLQKSTSRWGEHYHREMLLPLVRSTNISAYRRHNPLFEEEANGRNNPNNLWEAMISDCQRNIPLRVFTEVSPIVDQPNNVTYANSFKSRLTRLLDSNVLNDDGTGIDWVGEETRLANVSLKLWEDNTLPPDGY
jgi:hypothetical protein